MGSQRNTGAFIAGSVIGGIVGAAVALWKTPTSGPALRASLAGGRRFSNPVLGLVERAAAPIVGVDLGKLAKDDPQAYAAPVRASAADARPPGIAVAVNGDEVTEPLVAIERSPGDEPAAEETYDPVEGSSAHAATTADLTMPTEEYVEERAEEHKAPRRAAGDFHFRDVPGGDETR